MAELTPQEALDTDIRQVRVTKDGKGKIHLEPLEPNEEYKYPQEFTFSNSSNDLQRQIAANITECRKWLDCVENANDEQSPHKYTWFATNAFHSFKRLYERGLKLEAFYDGYFYCKRENKN